jgi:hypothetical protein
MRHGVVCGGDVMRPRFGCRGLLRRSFQKEPVPSGEVFCSGNKPDVWSGGTFFERSAIERF